MSKIYRFEIPFLTVYLVKKCFWTFRGGRDMDATGHQHSALCACSYFSLINHSRPKIQSLFFNVFRSSGDRLQTQSMSSRMSPRASQRRHQYVILASSPGSFYRRLFSYIAPYRYKTSAKRQPFVTGKCRLKVKSAGGTSQDGVKMAC